MAMTGQERTLLALEVKQPDRVPLYIHAINEAPIIGIARRIMEGLPEPKQFIDMSDDEKLMLIEALFRIHEDFGIDGLTTFEIGNEDKLDEKHLRDEWGTVSEMSRVGMAVPMGYPIREPEDLKKYRPPEPNRNHLLFLDLARDRFKGQKALYWMMRGIFVRSWRLVGMENLMLKMFDDPGFVHDLARMIRDYNLAQLEMLAEAGLSVLIVEDDIADKNFPLIAPDQFREFVNPYNRAVVEKAHALGLKVIRHSDGNLWPLLDILLDTGYDGLNPLEPQAGMNLKKVKDYCGDRLCLLGNIDCIDLLPNGTPQQVEEAVKQAINDAGQGGGLIICSSNSLHPGVNPDNCIAMFEAVHKHGIY